MILLEHPRALHEPADLLESLPSRRVVGARHLWELRGLVREAQEVVGHQLLVDLATLLLHERPLLRGHLAGRGDLLAERLPPLLELGRRVTVPLASREVEEIEHLEGVDAEHRRG